VSKLIELPGVHTLPCGGATDRSTGSEDGPTSETDELLARQDALQAEADAVLVDLDLLRILSEVGRPVRTGSAALGLMVARDIDVTTLCPVLQATGIFDAVRSLSVHPRIRRLAFRNDTGRWNVDPAYPDGLYWQVEYVAAAGVAWNLDLWFLLEGTTQFDLEHMRTLPPRLTPDTRLAILRIKEALHDPTVGQRVRGYEVYEAVLDHDVRTPAEFRDRLRRLAGSEGESHTSG
jgi:hypothetical protein